MFHFINFSSVLANITWSSFYYFSEIFLSISSYILMSLLMMDHRYSIALISGKAGRHSINLLSEMIFGKVGNIWLCSVGKSIVFHEYILLLKVSWLWPEDSYLTSSNYSKMFCLKTYNNFILIPSSASMWPITLLQIVWVQSITLHPNCCLLLCVYWLFPWSYQIHPRWYL